jgi:DNA-directed RNA polymerase specialized sigma24 family protein
VGRDEEFGPYLAARAPSLRRSAYLLCGDWERAEDLTRTALAKVYADWSRSTDRDRYAAHALARAYLTEQKRRRRDPLPQRPDLLRALAELPPRQRTAVVLRCWEDLPVAAVAEALGCSESTARSQADRGVEQLQDVLPEELR